MHGRALRTALVVGSLSITGLLSAQAGAAATPAVSIEPTGPSPTLPAYMGSQAKPRPLDGVPFAWQDPFMGQNPGNSVHNDAWQSDNYTQWGGPLGRNPKVLSSAIGRDCITLSFDRAGRLISTCSDLTHGPGLYLVDPQSLATLAFKQLPYVKPPAGTDPATNTTGGAYFYLDKHDRVVVAASNRHILTFAVAGSAGGGGRGQYFKQLADYDPSSCLTPGDRMPSVLPDAQGRLWFVGRYHGAVGVLDPRTGKCRSVILGEEIENSFAIAADGAYIVTDKAMYKFRAGNDLVPRQVWRMRYGNIGIQKPGQFNAGSGSTPTLIASPTQGAGNAASATTLPAYVAITDNADPMDVVVYRTGDRLARGQRRVICTVPVFAKGAGADENSLISMGRSLIVENNYGYVLQKWNDVISGGPGKPPVPIGGNLSLLSAPGMDRIDIAANGSGCRIVWRNNTVRTPSAVSKGDSANGLIYTFQKIKDKGQPGAGVWYWSALDYRTGKVVWMRRAGYGGLYNNHYSGIAIGANVVSGKPTLYLGGVGGLMALRDG